MKKKKNKKNKNLKTSHCQNERTHEELVWSKLTEIPYTPAVLRNVLNGIFPNTVRRFMEIMTSPQAIEADWLGICGHITSDQMIQYWEATGDYASCHYKIVDLAVEFSESVSSQLLALIEADRTGRKEFGLDRILAFIIRMQAIRYESLANFSQIISVNLGHNFVFYLTALIGAQMIALEFDVNTDSETKNHIHSCVAQWEKRFEKSTDSSFPGIVFYGEKMACLDSMKQFSVLLHALIGLINEEEFKCSALEKENIELYSYIKKEYCYKKIPLITLNDKGPQVILFRHHPDTDLALAKLVTVRINFNDYEIGYPQFHYNIEGELMGTNYGITPGIINFTLDPETGDLCFLTSCIPASSIMPKGQYVLLKNYVLRGLKKYLESKESDIDDLFQYSEVEIKERIRLQKENSQIQYVDDQVKEEEMDNQKEDVWQYVPLVKKEEIRVEDGLRTEKLDSLPKHKRVQIIDCISGANASEIHRALSRIFGGPERICGSHIFYQSDRNGLVLPVPAHSHTSRNSLATPLLITTLKKWGYSPMEFAIELGLKTID